jgi:5'(3')-deoxyribonucleotidase
MRKRIAIDMDHVIADVELHIFNLYEKEFGVRLSRNDILGIPESEAFPNKEAVRNFLYQPNFFRSIPVIQGAVVAIQELMLDYDIFIVSAAMEFPLSLFEKYEWLRAHFPFISWKNIAFCGDKSIIDTDYLIDDHCKNLDFFKGKPILYSASHNANIDRHFRVDNWEEVLQFFKLELN